MPYNNSDYSLMVILPSQCGGLAATEKLLSEFDFSTIDAHLDQASLKVHVALPRFTIDFSTSLDDALKNVGENIFFLTPVFIP